MVKALRKPYFLCRICSPHAVTRGNDKLSIIFQDDIHHITRYTMGSGCTLHRLGNNIGFMSSRSETLIFDIIFPLQAFDLIVYQVCFVFLCQWRQSHFGQVIFTQWRHSSFVGRLAGIATVVDLTLEGHCLHIVPITFPHLFNFVSAAVWTRFFTSLFF